MVFPIKMEKFKTYIEITNLGAIARRYFVNNFYDGMLTVLGILLGFFVLILKGSQLTVDSSYVILTGIGTSISMFISGFSGSYLSEKAEQKKIKYEIQKAMARIEPLEGGEKLSEELSREDLEKAMLRPVDLKNLKEIIKRRLKQKEKKEKIKTLYEKAESFAGALVSLVNGGAPFLGGLIPLIPFFIVQPQAGFFTFISSFIIIIVFIVLLGVFLGYISKGSIIKNILQMLGAFTITFLVITLFLE